jgi:hypothetical protein
MKGQYISPQERQAVIDAVKVLDASLPPEADEREHLASVLPKLPDYFADHDKLTNIAAVAHNAVVWFSGNPRRMFHKLGDLAEALCERDGVEPDAKGATQLQIEAARIRATHGHHVNG